MATRAQLTQERSRVRRDKLLAAAIELFAEGGSRAITHRAVASRAGLPPATTTYYFESIDELIREALSNHMIEWTRTLDDLTDVDFSAGVSLDDAVAFITAVFTVRGPEVAALELSIFLAAAREPRLHEVATAAHRSLEALATAVLTKLGVTDDNELAAALVALIGGTALRRQSGLRSDEAEARFLTAAIRGLVAAHVIGADGVDDAIGRLRERQP